MSLVFFIKKKNKTNKPQDMTSQIADYLYTPDAIKMGMASKRMQFNLNTHFNNTWKIGGFNNKLERFMQYIRKKKFNEASLMFNDIHTEWKAIIRSRPDFQQFVISEIKKDCFQFLLTSNNPYKQYEVVYAKALSVLHHFYFQECMNDLSAHLKFMETRFCSTGDVSIYGNSFTVIHPRANSQQMKFLLCLQLISEIGELNPIFVLNFRCECSKILANNNENAKIMFQAICDGMRNVREASLIISTFLNENSKVVIEDPANLYKLRYCLFNKSISEAVLLESVAIHPIMFQNPLYYMDREHFCAIISHPYYFMLYLIGSFINQFKLHGFVFIFYIFYFLFFFNVFSHSNFLFQKQKNKIK